MSSLPIRDQNKDHLLTPENSALIIIDYQKVQVNSIASIDKQLLVNNICALARMAKVYNVPVILSTVNVETGFNTETIPQLKKELKDVPSYDRTSINAWEDKEFLEAVKATGKKKLIMTALWTEACLSFPTLDALNEGFEVYPVVDAVGGTSLSAHETALRRMEQAGAKLVSVAQLFCELQRDWSRAETAQDFMKLFVKAGGTAGIQFGYHMSE